MKIKTSELTGIALDWAVAKCEGVDSIPNYSMSWMHAGPIIEREKLESGWTLEEGWYVNMYRREVDTIPGYPAELTRASEGDGPTLLIAAMRCYVASKLGDEIDLPEGLLK